MKKIRKNNNKRKSGWSERWRRSNKCLPQWIWRPARGWCHGFRWIFISTTLFRRSFNAFLLGDNFNLDKVTTTKIKKKILSTLSQWKVWNLWNFVKENWNSKPEKKNVSENMEVAEDRTNEEEGEDTKNSEQEQKWMMNRWATKRWKTTRQDVVRRKESSQQE